MSKLTKIILIYFPLFLKELEEDRIKLSEIKGSGICLSTDLGSTGYNFNLGGAILPLGSNLWSVLRIVCNRYLEDILSSNEITIRCNSKKSSFSVYLDGIDKYSKIKITFVYKEVTSLELLF